MQLTKASPATQKPGCHTAAFRAFRRELKAYVSALEKVFAPMRAALPPSRKRVVYEVIRPERCCVRVVRGPIGA